MTRWHLAGIGWLLVLASLTGCGPGGGATNVTQFPEWDFEHYQRIAVLPGRATTPRAVRDAGILADRLLTLLSQNGAFTVLSRTEMKQVFAEQDLSRLADAIDEGTALPEGKIQIAQALVATKLTDYKLIDEEGVEVIPRYARDRRGRILLDRAGRPLVAGEDRIPIYRHGAIVEGSVHVVDAATNTVLFSYSDRAAPKPKVGRGRRPSVSPEEMASEAARELSVAFYKAVAPTRIKVKLKGDMLIVATDYYDGKYTTPKKLPRTVTDFLLVVRNLPAECERNKFRVAIAEAEGRENLFEQELVWSLSEGPEGVSFKIPLAALTKSGGEQFVAKLYSGRDPQPILRREFSLAPPE